MASTTGPSTPERPPRNTNLNRSFTLPTRLATSTTPTSTSRATEVGATRDIEILYVHPNARVVKFAASSQSPKVRSGGQIEDTAGTLPWTSSTEQTVANGPMEIYRVPGSVSFLHSGSLLHTIMPRSQCWCVDGTSKFAMTTSVLDTYYRIDLPGGTAEDLEKLQDLEVTLRKVLRYERTACPFARGFSVELPEQQPQVRRRRRTTHGPAKKWRLHKAHSWKPENGEEEGEGEQSPQPEDENDYRSASGSDEEVDDSADDVQSDASGLVEEVRNLSVTTPSRPTVKERVAGLTAMRSVTSPPQLGLHDRPPSRLRTSMAMSGARESPSSETAAGEQGLLQSSLRTFQTFPTAMPPSPPDSSAGFDSPDPTSSSRIEHALQALSDPEAVAADPVTVAQDRTLSSGEPDPAYAPRIRDLVEEDSLTQGRESDRSDPASAAPATLSSNSTSAPVDGVVIGALPDVVIPDAKDGDIVVDAKSSGTSPNWSAPTSIDHEPGNPSTSPNPSPSPHAGLDSNDERRRDPPFDRNDPFAQIQARIQARRSIGSGGENGLTPAFPIRYPSSSSSGGRSTSSTKSTLSRHSQQYPHQQQHQQAFATALVRKAVSTFLGPPAALVAIMLRIAARFANGRFAIDFGAENSPIPAAGVRAGIGGTSSASSVAREARYVPGSFDLDGSDIEDLGLDGADDDAASAANESDEDEDDFGVPIRSPVRRANSSAVMDDVRFVRGGLRARSGWEVD